MKLKYAYGIIPGVSGSEQKLICQDGIKILEKNGISVISYGADAAAAVMAERFEEFYFSEDGIVKNAVLEAIKKVFQEAETETDGTDNSPLFVAVKENRYLAGHMGSGLIAVSNDGCTVLSKPETGNMERTDLRVYKGELQEPFGFMLLSDGACLSLYDYGTGSLSPACATFFEWLKEYDEETVSEALADNINKYFLKDVKGDICVAAMVTDEGDIGVAAMVTEESETAGEDGLDSEPIEAVDTVDEPETEPDITPVPAEPVETGEQIKASVKGKNYIKYLIAAALVILLTVVAVLTMNPQGNTERQEQGKAGSNPPAALSENSSPEAFYGSEPSVSFSADNPITYDAGIYQAGEDIPAGEYFFWTGEMLAPDSVKVNDFTCLSGELYCLTVWVNRGDTLASGYRFTAAENVNPVKAANGILISGKYKIGKDIAPGEYKISPTDKGGAGRYYSVLDGQISNKVEFNEEAAVVVPEEGYIVFYDSALAIGPSSD